MEKEKSLSDMYLTIREKAIKQEDQIEFNSDIQRARQLIQEFSIPEKKEFTYTIGELNAYMG